MERKTLDLHLTRNILLLIVLVLIQLRSELPILKIPTIYLFCYTLFNIPKILKSTVWLSLWTTIKTWNITERFTLKIVEKGTNTLDRFDQFKPRPPFSFDASMPMMAMATVEHRSPGQQGLIRYDYGGDDDGGDSHCARSSYPVLTHAERRVLFGQPVFCINPQGGEF